MSTPFNKKFLFDLKKSKPFELGFLFYVCLRFRLFIEERILSCVTDFLIG